MEDRPIVLTLKGKEPIKIAAFGGMQEVDGCPDRPLHVVAGGPGTAFSPSGCGGTEFYPPGHESPFIVRESVEQVRKLLGWR